MKIYTKEELIEVFKDIKSKGWIESARQGNAGWRHRRYSEAAGTQEDGPRYP